MSQDPNQNHGSVNTNKKGNAIFKIKILGVIKELSDQGRVQEAEILYKKYFLD